MKDAGIRIRVEKDLREAFVAVCQEEDRRASDVLREFMQTYVQRHQKGQGDLFVGSARRSPQKRKAT
ncbi:plasmid-related protein (plasmid) [Burkholderia gladioli]|uniref:plasmid-related protein n=1 Tax=Burkholderia gladioli TaxID=28095 RepID=UPI001937E038|nr:plasmid-related protein [Burkholderia gladioli]QPQ89157.1 plasmid-related protein [Burkholderia gladioli]